MLEKMKDFFAARVSGYEEHMLRDVEGCREGYTEMARALPEDAGSILDLGCGTGLELHGIFARFPHAAVTGIDLTGEMLDVLRSRFPDRKLELIEGDYFTVAFGEGRFDAAVSFQTMHHFSHEKKLSLYRKICAALKPGGVYIECDYMVTDPEEEAYWLRENERLRREQDAKEDEYYHFDTPFTVQHQTALLQEAGFTGTEMLFRQENTTLLRAGRKRDGCGSPGIERNEGLLRGPASFFPGSVSFRGIHRACENLPIENGR